MQTATYIKVFLICFIIGLTHRASAIITIDSAVTTPSRCANDGTITVYGHSGTSMIYAIVSGPDIRVPQSGNQFGGLPQGSYQVMITNFSNDTALIPAVVGGNYTFPDFAPTYADPFCAGTASGMIIGNALSTAKPPFTWILTNLTTNVTTTQASDSFLNLPAGSYSLRLLDSCQSFATRSVTLIDPNHSFTIGNINNELYSCDTVQVYIQLYIPGGNYAAPYTIQIQTHNGTYQHVINNFMAGGWYPEFRERVGGVTYGDYINITITDACGYSQYKQDVVAPFNVQVNFAGRTDTCQAAFAAYFAVAGYTGQQNVWPTFMNSPVTIVVSDPTTGVRIDSSMTYGDTIRGSVFLAYTPFLVSGHIYHISMTDGCGNNFSHDYQWPVIAPPTITQYPSPYSCYDSTGAYDIIWYNRFYTIPTFELLSGPTSIHSSKPHYTYQDTITYPQSYLCSLGGNNGTGAFAHAISLSNLGVGTYHYRVYDSCGNSFTDSFTIRPQDVSDYRYTFSFTRGCPGENVANISFNNVNYMASALLLSPNGTLVANLFNPPNTVRNLNAGTYVLSLTYYRSFTIPVNQNLNCWVMNDTIVIPPYALPQIAYATQVKCNGTVNVGLQPDSSKGIPPYKYEILSGPQTAAIQPSNFFTLTQPGTYVARISDTCGFAQTFTFTVDTLSFPQIVKVGSSCPGNSAMLITQHSAYATYTWQRPNGTFYTGDTLHLNPVLPTDYGVYHIVKYVSVNGCRDTFSTTYTLTSGGITDNFATICAGQSIVFAGHTYTQAGVYYDTIHTILCDSITILHLSIGGFVRDSVSVSICSGQTVTVGTHVYNTSGIYRDTFATTGCDSIHILNLQVGGVKRDSVSQSICSGQSITVGTHIYNTSGVYRDTFTTAGCDSVHILNLQVGSVRRDSVSQSICSGQSITVGTHIYNTSGIYRDTFATTGCDSIHILNLQVGGVKRDSVSQNICSGQSVTVGTHIYNTSGIYRDTFATTGCDSIHILNLQIGGMKRDSVSQNRCSGQSITVGTH
ncbi:MAG: hypothetical protein JWO03_2157, partial [Bacteroidetes bacterium]|nr:hypothetical protein [Bacteroidota bacterium]